MLPAVLTGVLAAMLVLQLSVPRALQLPEPAVVRPFALPAERIATRGVDPAIVARPIFGGAVAGTAVERPIDGATAIGVMSRHGLRTAFVRGADGQVASLAPGAVFHGWRLRAIDRDALVFDRDGRIVSLPVTAETHGAPPPVAAAALSHPIS